MVSLRFATLPSLGTDKIHYPAFTECTGSHFRLDTVPARRPIAEIIQVCCESRNKITRRPDLGPISNETMSFNKLLIDRSITVPIFLSAIIHNGYRPAPA